MPLNFLLLLCGFSISSVEIVVRVVACEWKVGGRLEEVRGEVRWIGLKYGEGQVFGLKVL